MTTTDIDRITIASKRAEADSLEMKAYRLRKEAAEIERRLLKRGERLSLFDHA